MHTCTHAQMQTRTQKHTCTHAHAHMHTCTHAHMHTFTHAHMLTCTHAHMHTCTQAHMHTSNHQTWNNMGRNINANAMKHRSKNDVKLIKIYVKLIENQLKLVQNRSLEGSGGHVGPQDPPGTILTLCWELRGSFFGPPKFHFWAAGGVSA